LENKNKKKAKKDKKLDLVFTGGINRRKNVLTTISACKILKDRGHNVTFTVIGPIDNTKIYNKLKEQPLVKYLGKKTKEELIDIYKTKDIFVMPSITETFGLVYAEALSQSLPVIYSKGQGFDCQFKEGTVGYHVNANDGNEIADKIELIIKNYDAISNNCYDGVDKFDWKKIAQKYVQIYKEIRKR